jgi:hypothetical protein
MLAPLALLLLALVPADDVVCDRVALIEVNHFYDEQGRLIFDQAIFYDWCPERERYQVRAWQLIKGPGQLPTRDWARGGWSATWKDGEILRRVQAASMRETWTQYDPELLEREWLPTQRRLGLSRGRYSPPPEIEAQPPPPPCAP